VAIKVGDVMSKPPLSVSPGTSARVAAQLMRNRRVRHLPVVDAHARVLGIITNRDLEHAAFLPALSGLLAWDQRRLKAPRVSDLMTWSAVTISPDSALAVAGLLMFERRIGSLVVVENDRLVGILTGRDLLRALGRIRAQRRVP
jgi:acetoin utilization protein AcuB